VLVRVALHHAAGRDAAQAIFGVQYDDYGGKFMSAYTRGMRTHVLHAYPFVAGASDNAFHVGLPDEVVLLATYCRTQKAGATAVIAPAGSAGAGVCSSRTCATHA
jgi:hypothetical protein